MVKTELSISARETFVRCSFAFRRCAEFCAARSVASARKGMLAQRVVEIGKLFVARNSNMCLHICESARFSEISRG